MRKSGPNIREGNSIKFMTLCKVSKHNLGLTNIFFPLDNPEGCVHTYSLTSSKHGPVRHLGSIPILETELWQATRHHDILPLGTFSEHGTLYALYYLSLIYPNICHYPQMMRNWSTEKGQLAQDSHPVFALYPGVDFKIEMTTNILSKWLPIISFCNINILSDHT